MDHLTREKNIKCFKVAWIDLPSQFSGWATFLVTLSYGKLFSQFLPEIRKSRNCIML